MIINGKTPLLEIFLSLAEAILIMRILFLLWLCNCIKLKKPSKISLLSDWEWEKFVFVCMWVGGFRNCNYLNTEETSKNEIYCIIVIENNESLWVQYKDSPQG